MRKQRKRLWRVIIGYREAKVSARNFGAAVHLACRRLGMRKPCTDHNTGGWVGVSADLIRE